MKSTIGAILFASVAVNADVYMHKPRGSNNRLNEANANRNNGNRLFDSQNNNRGGYNVGDKTAAAFSGNDNGDEPNTGTQNNQRISWVPGSLDKDQYAMQYIEESQLTFEWTNQHGCGGNERDNTHQLNCNVVLQFACNTDNAIQTERALQMKLKDGRNTNTPNTASSVLQAAAESTANDNAGRGRHESEAWYYECTQRNRDMNLFLADQNLNGNAAIYTRQNNDGNRRGLECAEERDYYPYWTPTPFMDIGYLTSNVEDCDGTGEFGSHNIQANSQNNNDRMRCSYSGGDDAVFTAVAQINTKIACDALTATNAAVTWKAFTFGIAEPTCGQGPWSRSNHLGNGIDGQTNHYNWTLPVVDTTAANGIGKYSQIYQNEVAKCILRIRYNISTDDYDPRNTDASSNEDRNNGVVSPIENDPTIDVKAALQGLRLAINTNQFGRTFQDRSHTFYIKKKALAPPVANGKVIINLNVRGKRGNIVQTFPSVEYDFAPNRLQITPGDFLHVQWTGSNTHNNGNPAGDGQAGDAGEGTGGTDRHNFCSSLNKNMNYPMPLDKNPAGWANRNLLKEFDCFDSAGDLMAMIDCAVALASSNYFESKAEAEATGGTALSQTLDNAFASLHGGIFLKARQAGEYNYLCSRNNNFTNRSQKGVVIVS
jgi:hypothetical protein